jgi:hypothetical protein
MAGNGSKIFKIQLEDSEGQIETLNFSVNYQALNELDEEQVTRHIFDDGSKAIKDHFINLEWELDYSKLLYTPDMMKIKKIKNARRQGKKIWLTPHVDVYLRRYKVQIIPEKRRLSQYPGSENYTPKKYDVIRFENVDPIQECDWVDSQDIQFGVFQWNHFGVITTT